MQSFKTHISNFLSSMNKRVGEEILGAGILSILGSLLTNAIDQIDTI